MPQKDRRRQMTPQSLGQRAEQRALLCWAIWGFIRSSAAGHMVGPHGGPREEWALGTTRQLSPGERGVHKGGSTVPLRFLRLPGTWLTGTSSTARL